MIWLLLPAGCATPVGVERVDATTAQHELTANALTADELSPSARNVLRGLHYQIQHPQGKLVRVIAGEVCDVVVDLRRRSATFGKWATLILSADNKRMAWIPVGFAHGFLVLSEFAEFLYKTTDYWAPEYERSLLWNDPDLAITWPTSGAPTLAAKDAAAARLADAEVFA